MFNFFKKSKRQVSSFLNLGFHGDRYLLDVVDVIAQRCESFVETGTNVGSTLAYVAKRYPKIKCVSCEPDGPAFEEASKNTAGLGNILLYNELSQDFIGRIDREMPELFERNTLFWLDAHGYGFKWPLKEELAFITGKFRKGFILIDDFKVPGLDCFKYDVYKDQVCSFEFIKDSLKPGVEYELFYPDYTEKTSPHHPLTGWGLIVFGQKGFSFPQEVAGKVKKAV